MRGTTLLVTVLMIGTGLAGCIGGDEPADDAVDTANTNDTGFLNDSASTAAPDGRGDLAAFKETNRTETGTGGMEHHHDYWAGYERIQIDYINSGMIPLPLQPEGKPAGTAIADYDLRKYRPPLEGEEPNTKFALVYEGTSQVELLLTEFTTPDGTQNHPQATMHFDYLTAIDEPGAFRPGGELKLNQPFTIDLAPNEADMPHQEKSLWIFRLYTGEPTWVDFNITITAVKGFDVVNWPPHPDLYAENPERTVFQGAVHHESTSTPDYLVSGKDINWINPERIISWGTQRLEVTVSNVRYQTATPGADPTHYLLEYHNATKPPLLGHGTAYGGRLQDESTDGTVWNFKIDLTGDTDSYDTPYGTGSRWGFRFVPQFADEAGGVEPCIDDPFLQQLLIGCQFVEWTLDYDLEIRAYGKSQEASGDELAES